MDNLEAFKWCESLLREYGMFENSSSTLAEGTRALGKKMFEAVIQVIDDWVEEDVEVFLQEIEAWRIFGSSD